MYLEPSSAKSAAVVGWSLPSAAFQASYTSGILAPSEAFHS